MPDLRGDVVVKCVVYDAEEEARLESKIMLYERAEPHSPYWLVYDISEGGGSAGPMAEFDNPAEANSYGLELAHKLGARFIPWSAPITPIKGRATA